MRKPDFIIEIEKRDKFVERLIPITDWTKVKKGDLIFHDTTRSIHSPDTFIELTQRMGIDVVKYTNSQGKIHTISRSGWFFFDEDLENEIAELFTPKLYKCDTQLVVACTAEEAADRLKIDLKINLSHQEIINKIELIDELDDYEINLQ